MTAQVPTIREALNAASPENTEDLLRQVRFGDLLSQLIANMPPTEAAAAVASNQKVLANAASVVLDVVATTGTVTGRKKLLIGPSAGANAVIPQTGQVLWDGGLNMTFAAVDGVTAANFTYLPAAAPVEVSLFQRLPGERD